MWDRSLLWDMNVNRNRIMTVLVVVMERLVDGMLIIINRLTNECSKEILSLRCVKCYDAMLCYVSNIGKKTWYRSYLSNIRNITYLTSHTFRIFETT
jgi:hypothetical protein